VTQVAAALGDGPDRVRPQSGAGLRRRDLEHHRSRCDHLGDRDDVLAYRGRARPEEVRRQQVDRVAPPSTAAAALLTARVVEWSETDTIAATSCRRDGHREQQITQPGPLVVAELVELRRVAGKHDRAHAGAEDVIDERFEAVVVDVLLLVERHLEHGTDTAEQPRDVHVAAQNAARPGAPPLPPTRKSRSAPVSAWPTWSM
jgi:hypothetical protein